MTQETAQRQNTTQPPSKSAAAALYKKREAGYTLRIARPGGCWRLLYLALVGVDTRAFSYATAETVNRCTVWGLQKSLYMNSYAARKALLSKRLVVTALLRAM